MTDTTIFDTGEKVDVLLKAAFGFPSASEKRAWYEETAVKYNTYVNGEDVLVETIPPIPDFDNNGIVRTAEELGLSTSDFYNYSIDETSKSTCSIVDDSSGIVRRIRHIILEETPQLGTDAGASWYKLDSSGNNVLIDSFQFNFKQYTSGGVVYSPYGYSVTTESAVSDGSLLPGGKKGGNWFIDIRSGLLFFPDFNNFSNGTQTDSKFQVNTTDNKPILTIYKYVGKKGVANLTTSGGSVGSSSSTVTGENIIKLESITTINRMGNEDTLVYNVEDSDELSKLGSDLVSIGAKQEVLYNLDGTVSTSDKGYKWTSIHLYKDASGNYYLNGTNFSDTVVNQIQHIKIDEILKKNYLLDDTKISSLFDSESLDVVGFATVTMNGTKRLGDLKKQWNAYNNDWLKITGNGLSYATMREGRHGCAYSFSSSNGMVIDTQFVDDDLRVMIGVYMENKNKNYSTIDTGALVQTLTNKTMDYNSNTFLNFPSGIEGSAELSQTLTNKTMDYNSNTFLNFPPGLQSSDNIGFSGNCTFSQPVYIGATSSDGTLGIFYNGPYYALNVMNSHPTFPQAYFWNFTNGLLIEANNSFVSNYALSVSGKTGVGLNVMNNNSVGIGTTTPSSTLHVNGTITPSSDDRVKHNEEIITNALTTISKLTPKHYFKTIEIYDYSHNFILDESGNPLDASGNHLDEKKYYIETGLIAQELQAIPELQFTVYGQEYVEKTITTYKKDNSGNDILDKNGNQIIESEEIQQKPSILGVDYNSIHCTHIAATKELHAIVQEQSTQLEAKDKQIADLQSQIATMQGQIQTLFTLTQS